MAAVAQAARRTSPGKGDLGALLLCEHMQADYPDVVSTATVHALCPSGPPRPPGSDAEGGPGRCWRTCRIGAGCGRLPGTVAERHRAWNPSWGLLRRAPGCHMVRSPPEVGIDSQCLTYVIDALAGAPTLTDATAEQGVALVRIYLHTPGTLWLTPTVEREYGRMRDSQRRGEHASWNSVLFGTRPLGDAPAVGRFDGKPFSLSRFRVSAPSTSDRASPRRATSGLETSWRRQHANCHVYGLISSCPSGLPPCGAHAPRSQAQRRRGTHPRGGPNLAFSFSRTVPLGCDDRRWGGRGGEGREPVSVAALPPAAAHGHGGARLFGVADLVQSCRRAVMGSRRAAFHAG